MKGESGKTIRPSLVVFDFDETLVNEDGETEANELLNSLRSNGVELAIASRNDNYQLLKQLLALNLRNHFKYIMADFRPKSFMIRHILWLYDIEDIHFDRVLFIDDYLPNVEEVKRSIPHIISLHFGEDIHRLMEVQRYLS